MLANESRALQQVPIAYFTHVGEIQEMKVFINKIVAKLVLKYIGHCQLFFNVYLLNLIL